MDEMKNWIDNASYYQLLEKWRHAPFGSPYFQGELGDYYSNVMAEKRDELEPGEAVAVSKSVGWN